jgi:hypothetical protein
VSIGGGWNVMTPINFTYGKLLVAVAVVTPQGNATTACHRIRRHAQFLCATGKGDQRCLSAAVVLD